MFDDLESHTESFNNDQAFDLLQELGRNTTEEIRKKRSYFRLAIKAGVTLQAGNSSELLAFKVKGVTGDISDGGFHGLFPIPVRVGDIYRLQFDRQILDLPLTFARCLRCRLLREDAFEAGFSFFSPICLPDSTALHAETPLIT